MITVRLYLPMHAFKNQDTKFCQFAKKNLLLEISEASLANEFFSGNPVFTCLLSSSILSLVWPQVTGGVL